jgi:predicted MFS family arabinose efflux permease
VALPARLKHISRELLAFTLASLVLGVAFSLVDSTFNNYLNDQMTLTGFQRSFLEFPRELPGLLVMFVAAGLSFLCSRRLSALAMIFSAIGALLMGFAPAGYALLVIWLFIYSMGQHLFMPLSSSIGMELANAGHEGKRLGELNAVRNLATILGSLTVVVGFRYLGLTFQVNFALAAAGLLVAALLLFAMRPDKKGSPKTGLVLHREYRLYYALNALSGSRKQIFITFAPWVLVTIFRQPTQTIATLMLIGGIIGIGFQPLLGWAIDHLGERFVLASEAVILVFICFAYGFARSAMAESTALTVICVCYLIDQMIFSVGMARSTYMKKIALRPDDIQPALTAAVSIDHAFSIATALLGGLIWSVFGFQYVFLLGMGIAVVNFFTALRVPTFQKPAGDAAHPGKLTPA